MPKCKYVESHIIPQNAISLISLRFKTFDPYRCLDRCELNFDELELNYSNLFKYWSNLEFLGVRDVKTLKSLWFNWRLFEAVRGRLKP